MTPNTHPDPDRAEQRARRRVVNAALAWAEDRTGGTDETTNELYDATQNFLAVQEAVERAKRVEP
jgi:hypothetical protein